MKINELVEMYKKNRTIDLKKVLEVEEYINTPLKQKMCELVLDSCMDDSDGILKINSLDRYILFTVAVIEMHTNLEFIDEENSSIDGFDALNEIGLIEKIVDTFKTDYDACQIILDMMTSDRIKNQDTLEKKIYRFIKMISDEFSDTFENIENKEDVLELLSSIVEK